MASGSHAANAKEILPTSSAVRFIPRLLAAVAPATTAILREAIRTMQHNQLEDRWIIEISGQAVGMVIRDQMAFVFYAAAPRIWDLDRQGFNSLSAAEQAVRDLFYTRPASARERR